MKRESFSDKLKRIFKKHDPNAGSRKLTCSNFWCKAPFRELIDNLEKHPEIYSQCPKCRSFSSNPTLSGGVENNGTTHYEGDRFDGEVHEVMYREYKDGAGFK